MSSGAPRWRMPLALLLSVLAHLLALAGIEWDGIRYGRAYSETSAAMLSAPIVVDAAR